MRYWIAECEALLAMIDGRKVEAVGLLKGCFRQMRSAERLTTDGQAGEILAELRGIEEAATGGLAAAFDALRLEVRTLRELLGILGRQDYNGRPLGEVLAAVRGELLAAVKAERTDSDGPERVPGG